MYNPIVAGSSAVIAGVSNCLLINTGENGFIVEYDQGGHPLFANNTVTLMSTIIINFNITTDTDGDIYAIFVISNDSTNVDVKYGSIMVTGVSELVFDVVKLNPGGIWKWVSRLISDLPVEGPPMTVGISVDCEKNVIICGGFNGTLTATRPSPLGTISLMANSTIDLFVAKVSQDRFANSLGVLRESGMVGDLLRVDFIGLSNSFTGLTPGISYYLNQDGVLTDECTHNQQFGVACSSSQMLLTSRFRPNH